jgi:hypothetical protein
MPDLKLHLDADASMKGLHQALLERGHDVTRTPNDWMPRDASDEYQLMGATTQGRCIFTFNLRDFIELAKDHPEHGGLILAAQTSWMISSLISALDKLLSDADADDWTGRIQWLMREGDED